MKTYFKKHAKSFAGLLCASLIYNNCITASSVTPLYSIRSQEVDAARELVGWTQHVNRPNDTYASFSMTTEYTRSFRSNKIADCLFGQSSCNNNCGTTINVSGSRTENRGAHDWLADYFYLPTDFQSTLHFTPRIENVIIDLNMYLSLDEYLEGLFFRAHAPITWTRWNLQFKETINDPGVNADKAGYFAPTAIARNSLLASFADFAHGNAPTGIVDAQFDALCYAQFDRCAHTQTGVADLAAILGYNVIYNNNYHLGFGIKVAAPSGNRPHAKKLFEPIVGNGHHWELGAHITSHATIWEYNNEESNIGFYLDANLTHIFKETQLRTFDLKNKPLSRYMLAQRMGTHIENELIGADDEVGTNPVTPIAQYNYEVTPIANLTTQNVGVSVAIQADIAAQLTFVHRGWDVDLGYNFWGRSCEKIQRDCDACQFCFAPNRWAIKGDTQLFGFASAPSVTNPCLDDRQPVALSATQSKATINTGTNFPVTDNTDIDSPKFALAGGSQVPLIATAGVADPIKTSIQPVFISINDIDFAGNRGLSHRLYTHISYNWMEHCDLIPYLGIGGSAEFGSSGKSCNNANNCSSCLSCALSQWGVWVKGGITF